MYKKFKHFFPILLALLLMGCKSNFIPPAETSPLPAAFQGADQEERGALLMQWQEFFPDSTLRGYIKMALNSNHNFRQTMENIAYAQSQLKRAKGALLPEVSAGVSAGARRFGDLTMDGIGNSQANEAIAAPDKQIPNPYTDFNIGLSFSWEIDFLGKLTKKRQATVLRWMSTIEAVRYAQTMLVAEVSTVYFNLVTLDKREIVLRNAIEETSKSLTLTRELKNEGIETQLAVDQFHTRLLVLEGLMIQNTEDIRLQESAFSLLLGSLPMKVKRSSFDKIQDIIRPAEVGVPAQLIASRPDIVQAELELKAAKIDVKAAKASFFPSIVIGGSGGWNSFDFASWFLSPASLAYNLAAGITAPIFNQHRIKAMYDDAKTSQRVALSRYHETVIKAYTDVVDRVVVDKYSKEQLKLKVDECKIQSRSLSNSMELFKLGYIGYLEVLSVVQNYLDSELEYLELTRQLCVNQVMLYRALGGGCNLEIK